MTTTTQISGEAMTDAETQSSAYEQGRAAYYAGQIPSANPHILFTYDRREWLAGWMAAHQQESNHE